MSPTASHFQPDAPEALARLMSLADPQVGSLLAAQAQRLRDDSEANRVAEAALLKTLEGRTPLVLRGRFEAPFAGNLTVVEQGDRAYAWLADDDLLALTGGGPAGNVRAATALSEFWRTPRPGLRSLRLYLYGGMAPLAKACAELGVADRVTHLALQTQDPRATPLPVARAFPKLRGMRCAARELPALLAEGAPELQALVVVLDAGWVDGVLDLARRAPALRHLGLWYAVPDARQARSLAAHPLVPGLASLEVFDVTRAAQVPVEMLSALPNGTLYLCGHQVAPGFVAQAGPRVRWVGWDRRETMALDFETLGWGGGAR